MGINNNNKIVVRIDFLKEIIKRFEDKKRGFKLEKEINTFYNGLKLEVLK